MSDSADTTTGSAKEAVVGPTILIADILLDGDLGWREWCFPLRRLREESKSSCGDDFEGGEDVGDRT